MVMLTKYMVAFNRRGIKYAVLIYKSSEEILVWIVHSSSNVFIKTFIVVLAWRGKTWLT